MEQQSIVHPPLLMHARQIEIALPADYNHALFRALNPGAPPAIVENTDVSGGAELLEPIAAVHGLEALAPLARALRASHASLHVVSPPKLVITVPPPENSAQ
jgi:hypothetical protein